MQAAIRLYERMGFERALDKEFVNQKWDACQELSICHPERTAGTFITSLIIKGRACPQWTALPFSIYAHSTSAQ